MSLFQVVIRADFLPKFLIQENGKLAVKLIGPEILLAPDFLKSKLCSFRFTGGKRIVTSYLRKRDGDLCHWCQKPMNFEAKNHASKRIDDDAPTIEHLKRKKDGGTNHLTNLALAHKVCNNNRHD